MDKNIYFTVFKNYKKLASNLITNICSFDSWSDEFSRSELKSLYAKLIKEFKDVDFTQFTIDELKTLDFQLWDEDIILMPVWALDCIPNGAEIYSINGDKRIYDKNKPLDKDSRFGASAYGFSKSQLRDSAIEKVLQ